MTSRVQYLVPLPVPWCCGRAQLRRAPGRWREHARRQRQVEDAVLRAAVLLLSSCVDARRDGLEVSRLALADRPGSRRTRSTQRAHVLRRRVHAASIDRLATSSRNAASSMPVSRVTPSRCVVSSSMRPSRCSSRQRRKDLPAREVARPAEDDERARPVRTAALVLRALCALHLLGRPAFVPCERPARSLSPNESLSAIPIRP